MGGCLRSPSSEIWAATIVSTSLTRSDGTSTGWDFPTYGDGLPHDLCHLVVEEGLGLAEGFWGLVDQHVDVALVNNVPTLMRDGKPLVEQPPGVDFAGLTQAEEAVALLAAPAVEVEQAHGFGAVHLGSPTVGALSQWTRSPSNSALACRTASLPLPSLRSTTDSESLGCDGAPSMNAFQDRYHIFRFSPITEDPRLTNAG